MLHLQQAGRRATWDLIYEMFVAAHDAEAVYVHRGCIEALHAIEENIYEQVTGVPF